MNTLQKLQEIALDLNIDISDCQDIDCIKKRINEATAVVAEELRKEYEEEIKEDKIKKNDYIKNSTENLINMIKEEQRINKKRDMNH